MKVLVEELGVSKEFILPQLAKDQVYNFAGEVDIPENAAPNTYALKCLYVSSNGSESFAGISYFSIWPPKLIAQMPPTGQFKPGDQYPFTILNAGSVVTNYEYVLELYDPLRKENNPKNRDRAIGSQ